MIVGDFFYFSHYSSCDLCLGFYPQWIKRGFEVSGVQRSGFYLKEFLVVRRFTRGGGKEHGVFLKLKLP